MLAMISTLVILIAASFAVIAMGMTFAGSWNLIVAAMKVSTPSGSPLSATRRAAGRRPVTVSVRTRGHLSSAAA